MNTENLTPASVKAIEAGGTNNAVMGSAMVKRGIMEKATRPDAAFRFVLTTEYVASLDVPAIIAQSEADAAYVKEIEAEEAEADTHAAEYEKALIERENAADRLMEIEALSDEFLTTDCVRAEEIAARLAELGAEPPSLSVPDAEIAFAEAVDADDMEAQRTILEAAAPPVVVRDPKETRYAHVERWTDDNLLVKQGILKGRLARRTLLRADRMQAERHLSHVEKEIEARGL